MKFRVVRTLLLSLVIPLVAGGIQWLIWDHVYPFVWFLFYPAVFLSAIYTGRWGALISSLISASLALFLFTEPRFTFYSYNPNIYYSILIFILMGVLFGNFHQQLIREREISKTNLLKLTESEARLRNMNVELENRVIERTHDLQNSEERFRLILENMQEGAQIIDFNWNYIFLNKNIEEQSRRSNLELVGKNFLEVWPGIEKTNTYQVLRKCMIERVPLEIENEFEYPDHTSRWFELSIQPVNEGVFVLSYDITERKIIENSLKMSTRLYSTISQINQTIIRTNNREELFDNVIKIVNQYGEFPLAWIGLFEAPSGNVTVAAHNHPIPFKKINLYHRPFEKDILSATFKTGKITTASSIQSNPAMKHWNPLSRQLGINSAACVPLFFQNKVIGFLNLYAEGMDSFESEKEIHLIDEIGQDISFALDSFDKEMKRASAEKQILESEERYRTIANYTYDWEFWRDPAGNFVYISPSCEQITGYTPQEFIDNPGLVKEIIHPEDIQIWIDHDINHIVHKNTDLLDFRIIRKNGDVRWISHNCQAVIRPDGTYLGRRASNRDITEKKQIEENLVTREKVLNLFVENSPAAIAMFDRNMIYMVASHRFLTDYRIPDDKPVIGHSHYEVFPEISDAWKSIHQRCLAGETIRAEEDPFPRADGTLDWVRWEIKPWYEDDNTIGGIILFSEVITEHINLNNALQKSEEQMRALVTSLDDIVFEVDYRGNYLNIWAGEEKLLKQPKDKLLGKTILEAFENNEEGQRFMEAINQVHATKEPVNLEYSLVLKNGTKWFTARFSPIKGKNLENQNISILVRDITIRKKAEEERQHSERQLRQIIDLVPHFIFARDASGKFVLANRSVADALGTTVEELTGTSNEDYLKNKEELQYYRDKDLEVINSGKTLVIPEEVFTDVEGKVRYLQTVKIPFDVLGTNLGVLGVSVDITERKQAERQIQLQLNRMRTLNEIGQAVTSSLNIQISLNFLLDEILAQLNVDASSVLLFNEVNQTLEFSCAKGFHTSQIIDSRLRLGEGLAGRVGKERKAIHITGINSSSTGLVRKPLFIEEEFVEYIGIPLIAKGTLKGVLEIFNRYQHNPDRDWMNYLETLGNQAALAIDNTQLFEDMQNSHQDLITAYDATISGWSHALDLRDKETEGHSQRVTALTINLARALNINREEQIHYRRGSLLHDIGKLGVPDSILLKPTKLTGDEWEIMKMHPMYAYQMLSPISYLRNAIDIPYCHHEKWDGSGYPRGLMGEQIPISARIFAVVDVWDALNSDRPYRKKWQKKQILDYLQQEKGKHFEPRIVDLFIKLIREDKFNGSLTMD